MKLMAHPWAASREEHKHDYMIYEGKFKGTLIRLTNFHFPETVEAELAYQLDVSNLFVDNREIVDPFLLPVFFEELKIGLNDIIINAMTNFVDAHKDEDGTVTKA